MITSIPHKEDTNNEEIDRVHNVGSLLPNVAGPGVWTKPQWRSGRSLWSGRLRYRGLADHDDRYLWLGYRTNSVHRQMDR